MYAAGVAFRTMATAMVYRFDYSMHGRLQINQQLFRLLLWRLLLHLGILHASRLKIYLSPPGFAIVDTPHLTGRGGGVARMFDERFVAKKLSSVVQPSTLEVTQGVVGCLQRSTSPSVVHVVICRPGSQVEPFFGDSIEQLEIVATYRCQIFVPGDFSIHVNDLDNRYAQRPT